MVAPNRSLLSLKKSVIILSFAEMWDRFIFYGTLTSLIFYLTQNQHFSDKHAYVFWSVFLMLAYTLPAIGGFLADKYIGLTDSVLLGGYGLIVASLMLFVAHSMVFFIFGITFLLISIGFFKGNISSLLGTLYEKESEEKDRGFSYFYVGMATGAILGPISFGLIHKYFNWQVAYLVSCLGIASSILLLKMKYKKFRYKSLVSLNISKSRVYGGVAIFTIILYVAIYYFLNIPEKSSLWLGIAMAVLLFGFATWFLKSYPSYRKRLTALVLLVAATVIYYAAVLQVDGAMLVFVKRYIHHSVFSWEIPVTVFSTIEPIFSILAVGFFANYWARLSQQNRDLSVSTKITIGIFMTMISFIFLWLSAVFHTFIVMGLVYLLLGNLFLGMSDACVIPIVMSSVSRYTPKELSGTFMGIVFMRNAVAGYLAYHFSLLSITNYHASNLEGFEKLFLLIALICFIVGCALWIMGPLFKFLLNDEWRLSKLSITLKNLKKDEMGTYT